MSGHADSQGPRRTRLVEVSYVWRIFILYRPRDMMSFLESRVIPPHTRYSMTLRTA